nr:ATP-binding protein [Nitrosophilus labii]
MDRLPPVCFIPHWEVYPTLLKISKSQKESSSKIANFSVHCLNENQADLFFQIINKRYESGSIIITSNLNFTKFKEVLNNDEALTTAILDRLIHHSHILNIQGESYRLKQKRKAGIFTGLNS